MANQIKISEEFKPDVVNAICQKIKLLNSQIIIERENIGENSYLEIISAYESLKSALKYIEIGE